MDTSQPGIEPSPTETPPQRRTRSRAKVAADEANQARDAAMNLIRGKGVIVRRHKSRLDAANRDRVTTIAELVSDKPGAVTWYHYAGALTKAEVMEAAGIKSHEGLHRIMVKYRAQLAKRPARERKAKGMAT